MKTRITVTVDADVLRDVEARVAAGEARSLSAWVSDVMEQRVRRETISDVVADILAETGGPPTEEERAEARRALGL